MKENFHNMTIVKQLCGNCHKSERVEGQSWCANCRKLYQRQWRRDQTAMKRCLREENKKLRAENAELKQQLSWLELKPAGEDV